MYTDSHCHIDFRVTEEEQVEIIARAREAGVSRMVTIGSGSEGEGGVAAVPGAQALAERFEGIWFTAGVHPHDAGLWNADTESVLRDALAHPRCVAIGECGLDYFYDYGPEDAQIEAFQAQIRIAKELGKPIVIHARDSKAGDRALDGVEHCLQILEAEGAETVGGVMHCFAGDRDQSKRSQALNFMISVPGIVTFKKPGNLAEVVPEIPDDALLIETDSPYLAPHPKRGKRNEPAYLIHTAARVAELRGQTPAQVAELTSRNAARLYGLPAPG